MSNIERLHRVRIHTAGTQTPSGGTVDFTFAASDLVTLPRNAGQKVDILRSSTQSPGFEFEIAATDTNLGRLATGGEMDLLHRLAEWQVSTDGGTNWTNLVTARIARIDSPERTSRLGFTLKDERIIERRTGIFESQGYSPGADADYAGTILISGGPDGEYGDFGLIYWHESSGREGEQAEHLSTPIADTVRVTLDRPRHQLIRRLVTGRMSSLIDDDLKPNIGEDEIENADATDGNYETLRCRVNGTLRSVHAFSPEGTQLQQFGDNEPLLVPTPFADEDEGSHRAQDVFVVWPGYASETITEAKLVMPDAPPSPEMPLHIGGQAGIHPFQLVKDIYDDIGVRYDSAALQALIDDPSYPKQLWRITEPAKSAAEWLEEHVYKPFGVVPFIDEQGRIALRSIRLPTGDEVPDVDTLLELDGAKLTGPHPSWSLDGAAQVTRVVCEFAAERGPAQLSEDDEQEEFLLPPLEELPFDFMESELRRTRPADHPNIATAGVREQLYKFHGLHFASDALAAAGFGTSTNVSVWRNLIAKDVFARFGNGPIPFWMHGLSAVDVAATDPGKFVILNLASFANWATGTRGGPRLVQVIEKIPMATTRTSLRCLDAGQKLQPLTAPTISAAQDVGHPTEAVVVTIVSWVGGERFTLQTARSVTEPAASSDKWQTVAEGVPADSPITVAPLASGSTYWFRMRAHADLRISSLWSAAVSASTAALSAPTGLTVSNETGSTAVLNWTNGESRHPVQVLLDDAACISATRQVIVRLPVGSTRARLEGLKLSTTYCAGVRHTDWSGLGGVSAESTAEFTTGSTLPVAPNLEDIAVWEGALP